LEICHKVIELELWHESVIALPVIKEEGVMKNLIGVVLASLLLAVACITTALAADTGIYLGGNVGQSRTSLDAGSINASILSAGFTAASTSTQSTDTGYKLFGGYRFHPNFAMEAGYFSLGTVSFTTTTLPAATITGSAKNSSGYNLDAIGIIPLAESFSLFGRVGVQNSKTELTATASAAGALATASTNNSKSNYKAGLGAEYSVTKNAGVRAEWERYRVSNGVNGDTNVDFFSAGLLYRF
jgi:OOP family OmpA-OmpF porin